MAFADRSLLEQKALRYCGPRGIPLSKFLEQRVGEPDWTDRDAVAALDWQDWDVSLCPGCRQPVDECMAHEDVSPEYRAEVKRCHACRVVAIDMKEAGKDVGPESLYSFVRKVG